MGQGREGSSSRVSSLEQVASVGKGAPSIWEGSWGIYSWTPVPTGEGPLSRVFSGLWDTAPCYLQWFSVCFSGVLLRCCCSVPQLCPTLCDPMDCSMPGFPVHHQLLEFAQIESVMPPNHLLLYHPLLLLPRIFPSIKVFSDESALCIR